MLSTSLQYIAVNQLYQAWGRLYQFLSALALVLHPWARADKTDAAFARMV